MKADPNAPGRIPHLADLGRAVGVRPPASSEGELLGEAAERRSELDAPQQPLLGRELVLVVLREDVSPGHELYELPGHLGVFGVGVDAQHSAAEVCLRPFRTTRSRGGHEGGSFPGLRSRYEARICLNCCGGMIAMPCSPSVMPSRIEGSNQLVTPSMDSGLWPSLKNES